MLAVLQVSILDEKPCREETPCISSNVIYSLSIKSSKILVLKTHNNDGCFEKDLPLTRNHIVQL